MMAVLPDCVERLLADLRVVSTDLKYVCGPSGSKSKSLPDLE
jgi:hypothetical protein